MATTIQMRRGTAAAWTSANPILAEGEQGVELDTGKWKLGNGIDHWGTLAYSSGPAGPAGPTGSPGAPGTNGSVWRDGTGAPANALGANGDYYLDDATGNVYYKSGGTYAVVANIKGATGATGPAGATGAAGTPGSVWRDGTGAPASGLGVNGDYYLNDSTGDVYLKSAGAYSVVANIKGATGATGSAGATGPTGPAGQGVPTGGATGQVLTKNSATNYDTLWSTPTGGGGAVIWEDVGAGASLPVDELRMQAEGLLAQTGPREYMVNNTGTGAGTLRLIGVWLKAGTPIGHLYCAIGANGTSITLAKLGIWNPAGTLLVATADLSASINSGSVPRSLGGVASYTVPTSGFYYFGIIQVGTTPATVGCLSGASTGSFQIGTNPWPIAAITGQTDAVSFAPASLTNSGVAAWIGATT